jgi:hypothetical protein
MKKLKRPSPAYSKRLFGFAATGCSLAAIGAHAQTIIQDNFTDGGSNSHYGAVITETTFPGSGISPSGTNLPGGTWQLSASGYDGVRETNAIQTSYYIGTVADYAYAHNGSAAAISLISTGGYVEPSTLNLTVTTNPAVGDVLSTVGTPESLFGFYNAISASDYGAGGQLLGLSLTNTGALNYEVGGLETATGISAGTGIFDSNGFTTVSFQLAFDSTTDKATFSNITLDGQSYSNTYTTGPLSASAINYAGFSSNVNSGGSAFTDLTVAGVGAVPEPGTYAMLAFGAMSLGAFQYRRRQR